MCAPKFWVSSSQVKLHFQRTLKNAFSPLGSPGTQRRAKTERLPGETALCANLHTSDREQNSAESLKWRFAAVFHRFKLWASQRFRLRPYFDAPTWLTALVCPSLWTRKTHRVFLFKCEWSRQSSTKSAIQGRTQIPVYDPSNEWPDSICQRLSFWRMMGFCLKLQTCWEDSRQCEFQAKDAFLPPNSSGRSLRMLSSPPSLQVCELMTLGVLRGSWWLIWGLSLSGKNKQAKVEVWLCSHVPDPLLSWIQPKTTSQRGISWSLCTLSFKF